MARFSHFYLIEIQYLGFRFHGWQKQPSVKTVHDMVDKTLSFALGHENFKTMGSSRTDAKVSSQSSYMELFLKEPLEDLEEFLIALNTNFSSDLRALSVKQIDETFNILHQSKLKEYHYYFSFGEKPHPYAAPFVYCYLGDLDVEPMKQGAKLFLGEHNFKGYCVKPKEGTEFNRIIEKSSIEENTTFTATFFPEKTWVYKVSSKGFLRNQVRLMMGQLLKLGAGKIDLDDIKKTLHSGEREHSFDSLAPASGLHLIQTDFTED